MLSYCAHNLCHHTLGGSYTQMITLLEQGCVGAILGVLRQLEDGRMHHVCLEFLSNIMRGITDRSHDHDEGEQGRVEAALVAAIVDADGVVILRTLREHSENSGVVEAVERFEQRWMGRITGEEDTGSDRADDY
jgi:hypothetical protein